MTPPQRDMGMEGRVSQLEIQMGIVFARLKPLEDEIPENRRFRDNMNTFKTDLLARQDEAKLQGAKQHKQNSFKLNMIGLFVAICTMILAGIAILVSIQIARHQSFNIPSFLHSQTQQQQEASETRLPPTYQMR